VSLVLDSSATLAWIYDEEINASIRNYSYNSGLNYTGIEFFHLGVEGCRLKSGE
jgi:hypothetical protein